RRTIRIDIVDFIQYTLYQEAGQRASPTGVILRRRPGGAREDRGTGMQQAVNAEPKPFALWRGIVWLSEKLLVVERRLVAFLMVLLTGAILLNVATRYTGRPIYWIDEFAVYCMVWLTFFGASVMTRLRLDFAVTMLTERLSERAA